MPSYDPDRDSRQTRFAPLGGVVAMTLARAGIGRLRLIDRDLRRWRAPRRRT